MIKEHVHPQFGPFIEQKRNFTTYLVGRGAWMGESVEFWAMGGASKECVVRNSSIAVLEQLMADQSALTDKIRRQLVEHLLPNLRQEQDISEMSGEAFCDLIVLKAICTDDDLNFEFLFDTTKVGLRNMICVYGTQSLGIEGAFLDRNSPN